MLIGDCSAICEAKCSWTYSKICLLFTAVFSNNSVYSLNTKAHNQCENRAYSYILRSKRKQMFWDAQNILRFCGWITKKYFPMAVCHWTKQFSGTSCKEILGPLNLSSLQHCAGRREWKMRCYCTDVDIVARWGPCELASHAGLSLPGWPSFCDLSFSLHAQGMQSMYLSLLFQIICHPYGGQSHKGLTMLTNHYRLSSVVPLQGRVHAAFVYLWSSQLWILLA